MKNIYVLDTNVHLADSTALYAYKEHDIIIPLKVLEEIDKHKKRQDGVGANARHFIRILDDMRAHGDLHIGVKMLDAPGKLSVRSFDPMYMPDGLDKEDSDNQIIATALKEKSKYKRKKVILVTQDINMRVKCDSLGFPSEDFTPNKLINSQDELFTGIVKHLVDDEFIDQFYDSETALYLEEEEVGIYPNQYVMLVSNQNEKKTALAKFRNYSMPLINVSNYKNNAWGIHPRNKEQRFALDLLSDESIPIVTITGKAGTGKTLLALSAGLEQVLENNRYKKLIVSKPVQAMGSQDIGFLPGTLEEKMRPWLMPIQDNLDFLMNGNASNIEHLYEDGTIEIEALSYIRGRSISNAYIIIDEVQNLSPHELKTIVTRVGENTKIILTGDIEQIDNVYLDSTSNGLSYAIEKFKSFDLAGHISLIKGERSKVATLAAKVL
tara:strand:- start:3133 stop:4446 length:1314 start_codon:yes stop_codon:yes gene_type:complete